MSRKKQITSLIAQDYSELISILQSLPPNPFPWAAAVKLVAPLVARLAIRMALKRMGRTLGQDKISTITASVVDIVRRALENETAESDKDKSP